MDYSISRLPILVGRCTLYCTRRWRWLGTGGGRCVWNILKRFADTDCKCICWKLTGTFGQQEYSQADKTPFGLNSVFVRPDLNREHTDFSIFERDPWNSEPINKRAWTLQEALLSNRAVFFTKTELKWLCNERRQCECGKLSSPIRVSDLGDSAGLRLRELFSQHTLEEVYGKWDDIVMSFTKRSLTYEKDRLPALSGLARRFEWLLSKRFDHRDHYLAGLWETKLSRGLLWKVDDYTTVEDSDSDLLFSRPNEWRARSWSWAALNAPVVYAPYIGLQCQIELLGADIEQSTIDHYGRVKSGHLRIRARMLCDLSAHDTGSVDSSSNYWSTVGSLNVCGMRSQQAKYTLHMGNTSLGMFCFDCDDSYRGPQDKFCALIMGYQKTIDTYILLMVRERRRGEWERISIASYATVPPHNADAVKRTIEETAYAEIVLV